jgi:hypothetical protein
VHREAYLLEDLAAPSDAGNVEGGKLNQTTDPSVSTRFGGEDKVAHPFPGSFPDWLQRQANGAKQAKNKPWI